MPQDTTCDCSDGPVSESPASAAAKRVSERLDVLGRLVGRTPLVRIDFRYMGEARSVYAKLEYYNYSGSIKDRMALHILRGAYASGSLRAGDEIVEATSGNTGIAFAAQGAFLGHRVRIFMPDWMSEERKKLIRSYGAEVVEVSREQGGFLGSIRMANDYAQKGRAFLPHQFENPANTQAHFESTGPEIWSQLSRAGVTPDGFVAGVGTGGTVMGAGLYLRSQSASLGVHPLEPANSPTLTTGHKTGKHRIQGISDEFIPDLVSLSKLNEIIAVDDGDAILMAQKLARDLGLGVGISSGANFLGSLKAQLLYGERTVVTVFADDSKKYLSTDYARAEPIGAGFFSPDIELLGFVTLEA